MKYLSKIRSPYDIKNYDIAQLEALAAEIRQVLIGTVSENGGHLASNLGTVELTIALHKVFDSPKDRIVFDVGHQCYTHKLLTGRYEQFSTLRMEDGISGFPNPEESEHDTFLNGHSSTSVSTSLGLATADRLDGKRSYSVAVIGDGSFTGGMVYEALNNGGKTKNRQIVILNDNNMSISENVGVFSKQLAVLRSKPGYFHLKATAEKAINRIPAVGEGISASVFKLKTDVKNKIYDKSNFFEQLGYRYMGPIDGHNIAQLCDALNGAKGINGPVLLHVLTVKGKGYSPAEQSPSKFHGISAFNIESGSTAHSGKTYSDYFGELMCNAAQRDNRVCAVTAAMALGTGLTEFSERFSGRFFDVGIAEQHAAAFCAGLAKKGKIPVFAVYSTFFQRCYDQVLHDVALQKLHTVFAVDRAGFVGEDGETHQGIFDVAFLNGIPGVKVYSPCSFEQMKRVFEKALFEDEGPVVIRYPRGGENTPALCRETVSDVYYAGVENPDTCIISYGRVCAAAGQAVRELEGEGESVGFLGLNRIKPIPSQALEQAAKAKRILFFEEGTESAGTGCLFALGLLKMGYKGEFSLTAVPDTFATHAPVASLLKKYGLDKESIIKKVKNIE